MSAPTTTSPTGATARPTCRAGIRHSWADYSRGLCRCPAGREAWRLYGKRRREGRQPPGLVDATGTQRRIGGLLAMGWPRPTIAAAAGLADQGRVRQVFNSEQVLRRTADGVRRAAATLGTRVGPSDRVRDNARRAGHIPLWAWDDNIDDPAAKPSGVPRVRQPMPTLSAADKTRIACYIQPAGGGCARWTGPVDELGAGRIAVGPKTARRHLRARRVSYWLATGHQPAGKVTPSCGNAWCVAGRHMVDSAGQQAAA